MTEPSNFKLDEIDFALLRTLQERARISNVELADLIGLSPAPCLRRVQTLERAGIIKKYVALLDAHIVKQGVTLFVQISLDLQVAGRLDAFEKHIQSQQEVLECYLMTGDADYLLRVVVPDVAAYERFLKDALTRIDGVVGIKSSFALRQVKYSTALPLPNRNASVSGPSSQDIDKWLDSGDVVASRRKRKRRYGNRREY